MNDFVVISTAAEILGKRRDNNEYGLKFLNLQ
jgi:hypothetical protein